MLNHKPNETIDPNDIKELTLKYGILYFNTIS